MEPRRGARDYLAGSVVVAASLRLIKGGGRRIDRFLERAAARIGVREAFQQTGSFRAFAAILMSGIIANGLALLLIRKGISPWGIVLRLIGFGVAWLGLLCRNDWKSLRETSFFIRGVRFFWPRR